MTQDEAFLQEILAHPDDNTPRLIYADWLDEHDQSERAEYLRAECRIAAGLETVKQLAKWRRLASLLEAVWVARVSRPPLGVCVRSRLFVPADRPTTEKAIRAVERRFGMRFPADYRAFLLNYNGGGFAARPADANEDPNRSHIEEWFWGIDLGEKSWLGDLGTLAESCIEGSDGVYSDAGLFPIGAPEQERMLYLLETSGERTGRVVLHDHMIDPWDQPARWARVAPSFAALLARLS
jgi:uncharacterized protein (TIGR02996 family)